MIGRGYEEGFEDDRLHMHLANQDTVQWVAVVRSCQREHQFGLQAEMDEA